MIDPWLHRVLPTAFAVCATASSIAQTPPRRPDESGAVRVAEVHHILVPDRITAANLLREILVAPAADRLQRFGEVARRASKDPGSSPSGGDLGTVHEGEMVRSFETAVLAARPNEVTGPFRSDFGWHLAYVTRFGERPVAEICRSSIEKAASSALDRDKAGISLASSPVDRSALPSRIEALLGAGWHGPLADQDGNLAYLKSGPSSQPAPLSWRIVTRHTEFTLGKLVSSIKPMGCARSVQEQWAVDCQARAIALLSIAEFEGRAAAGRRVTHIGEDPRRVRLQAVSPGTLGAQLHEFACKTSATPNRTI